MHSYFVLNTYNITHKHILHKSIHCEIHQCKHYVFASFDAESGKELMSMKVWRDRSLLLNN